MSKNKKSKKLNTLIIIAVVILAIVIVVLYFTGVLDKFLKSEDNPNNTPSIDSGVKE